MLAGGNGSSPKALVVGATGSIGSSIARMLAARDIKTFLTYSKSHEKIAELQKELGSEKVAGHGQVDLIDLNSIEDIVRSAHARLGRIDILINTVGYMHDVEMFVDASSADVHKTIAIELVGYMHLVKCVLPYMISQNYGRIVAVGSDSGKVGAKGVAASAAARGGIIAFGKSIAREVGEIDICINTVCPGPTEGNLFSSLTDRNDFAGKQMRALARVIPKKRIARPEEVASLVVFLASPEASFITGQAISATGGLTMC